MSLVESNAQGAATPSISNAKAAAAAPRLSDSNHVELESIMPNGQPVNPDEDIMQFARMGDIPAIESLYESAKFDASYCDAEGITPLHVCLPFSALPCSLLTSVLSGPPSIINMRCANSSYKLVQM